MKRLVIHPADKTTDFLRPVYEHAGPVTLIAGSCTQDAVRQCIHSHDQVIVLGHGSPLGLLSVGQFADATSFVVGDRMGKVLGEKSNNVLVWCHADRFANYHGLRGFYTGMFISEMSEAFQCGIRNPSGWQLANSNRSFAAALGMAVAANMEPDLMYAFVRTTYGEENPGNEIVKYNMDRMGYR